jgi:cytochrome P450
MDPPEHTEFRRIVESYFSAERMLAFEPVCREVSIDLIGRLPKNGETELIAEFADVFAVEVQCAFLEWPATLRQPLLQWTRKNHAATRAGDKAAMEAIACEFDGYIQGLLEERRRRAGVDDAVARLLRERVHNRPLSHQEIVSVLRNWTVGELSTISACVGILAHYLAEWPQIQQQLRERTSLLPLAIDEILRIQSPFNSSRRITTEPVEIGGRALPSGARVTLMWASANRDEDEFGDPDEYRLDRDPAKNLLYGSGIHICPGAPLARLELRVLMEELLRCTSSITRAEAKTPVRALYPGSGYSSLPLQFH